MNHETRLRSLETTRADLLANMRAVKGWLATILAAVVGSVILRLVFHI